MATAAAVSDGGRRWTDTGTGGSGDEWMGISVIWGSGGVWSSRKVYITLVAVVVVTEGEKPNLREGFIGGDNSEPLEITEKRVHEGPDPENFYMDKRE